MLPPMPPAQPASTSDSLASEHVCPNAMLLTAAIEHSALVSDVHDYLCVLTQRDSDKSTEVE